MSRQFFGVEKGYDIFGENGDLQARILFSSLAPDGLGDQSDAPIGSILLRSNGSLYQKIANAGNAADWQLNGNGSSSVLPIFQNIIVRAATGDALVAGVVDPTSFSDNESGLDGTAFSVGEYLIGGVGGTPILYEVTAVGGASSITIAVASPAMQENDGFVVRSYLPDSPANQENTAGVMYQNGNIIKLFDVDFAVATGISLSGSYAPVNGTVAGGITVETAISYLDGNQIDILSSLGISQGDTNFGTFTGTLLPDNQSAKQLFQALETAVEGANQDIADLVTLTGVPANSTDLGTFTGVTISDNVTIKTALQELETAHESVYTLLGVSVGDTDFGTFTGSTLSDNASAKTLFQELETAFEASAQDVADLITLSGRPANSTDHGAMSSGDILSDNATTNALFLEIDAELTRQRGKSSAAAVTAATVLDSVLVDEVSSAQWLVTAEDVANPARKRHFIVHAGHNGHSAADATEADDTVIAILKQGTGNFNVQISAVLNGAGGAQEMRLQVNSSEAAGVNFYAKRIENLF